MVKCFSCGNDYDHLSHNSVEYQTISRCPNCGSNNFVGEAE